MRQYGAGCALFLFFATTLFAEHKPDSEGFVCDWLVTGPYPNYQTDGGGQALDTDFLSGEADFVPYPGMKAPSEFVADAGKLVAGIGSTNEWGFTETKTFDATWQVKSFPTSKISFDKMFLPIDDYFAVYAVCWIESPCRRKIKLGIGSDDDHKIYLNGKLVGRHYGSQATIPDQFMYDAELQPGLNRILFKLVDRTNDASFCLRLSDTQKKPMSDLIIYTDSPAREYGTELYQNGYAGNLSFKTPHLFAGPRQLNITIFSDRKEAYTLLLNGKPTKSGTTTVNLSNGNNLLKLEVIVNGQTVAILQKEVTAYSREALAAENESLKREVGKNAALLSSLNARRQILEKQLTGILADRKKIYREIEQKYAAEHEAACREGKRSTDEPMTPATVRSRLCINGEWEASTDRKNWSEFVLPAQMYDEFFRNWFNPVKNVDAKNPYGRMLPLNGWENFRISPMVHAQKAWFRRQFTTDGNNAVTLVCTGVLGKLQVYLNGKKCGDYAGRLGILEFPLGPCKRGANQLELRYEFGNKYGLWNGSYGIVGDLYLDFTSPVKMADVWVQPSWRKANLSLTSEIENRTDKEQTAEIRQYVAKDGRIKLRLPDTKQSLPPRQTVTFKNSEKWADPLLWGIGGEYGNPDLYDLVSDVYVDGKMMDRYVQPFGFREFWIHATDFYLNGKRIILQGDVGIFGMHLNKYRDVLWPLLRHDGINTFRYHDSDSQWSGEMAAAADRMGMLSYVQMYPVLYPDNIGQKPDKFSPFEEWTTTPEHQYNLENYRRWFRLFRNHPSVVIWSTDNELFTQAWDTAARREFNIRNDKVGALYEKYMKTLDPDLILTRDGDIGTWSRRGRWFENPPCDTANYHYPEFNSAEQITNWQDVYDYRPVIFGETLYNAYFHQKIASPELISQRAAQVRGTGGMYRTQEIPGQIFMGLTLDGFVIYDDFGKGNPWGITKTMRETFIKDGALPPMMRADQYPWFRVAWPAYSGQGRKDLFGGILGGLAKVSVGTNTINWFDPRYPTHIRNAVNDAYKETLLPQPPLREPNEGECVLVAKPFADVWSTAADGTRYGVRADKNGKAWFQLPTAGQYTFEANGVRKPVDVPSRKPYAAQPGFDHIKFFELK